MKAWEAESAGGCVCKWRSQLFALFDARYATELVNWSERFATEHRRSLPHAESTHVTCRIEAFQKNEINNRQHGEFTNTTNVEFQNMTTSKLNNKNGFHKCGFRISGDRTVMASPARLAWNTFASAPCHQHSYLT